MPPKPEPQLLCQLLSFNVDHYPERSSFSDERRWWTWSEFSELVQGMASVLRHRGVGQGDRVAVFSGNRVEVVAMTFAIGLLGGVVVPLNDRLQAQRVRELLDDSGAVGLVTDLRLGRQVDAHIPQDRWRLCFDTMADRWPKAGVNETLAGPPGAHRYDVALIMYTSGTTAKAKGVILSHHNILEKLRMWIPYLNLTRDSRYLQQTPLFHIGGFAMMMVAVEVGMFVHIASGFQPDLAARAIHHHRITHTLMVPSMVRWLLLEPAIRQSDFSSLQVVLYGGSPMPMPVLREAMTVLGCGFVQGYGLTETVAILTALTVDDHATAVANDDAARLGSVGRALAGIDVRLVGDDGLDVGAGRVGEILARGPHITSGYHGHHAANQDTFQDGWFRTGDLGRMDEDGYLSIVGRKKDLIIVGGENVAPSEVEAAIANIDGVAEVAVVGAPHPVWGESVCAFVVLKPGVVLGERFIITRLRHDLASFQCPRRVVFVDELPRNAAGKIEKTALRQSLWIGDSEPS